MDKPINENHEYMADGHIDIENPQVLVALNAGLAEATMKSCITPYVAWAKVQKVLATYHIFIPNTFLEGADGNEVVPINQFGKRFGQTNDGDFMVRDESDLFLYFEWEMNESGLFKIFAEIVNGNDLDEILNDYDAEVDAINEASELKMGMEDEKEEHHMSDKEAKKTAKQHLKKNKHYYSILKKVGLGEAKSNDDKSSEDIKRIKAKYALKDAEKAGHKKSPEWLLKMVKRKNKKIEEDKDPCWNGYEMVGMKKKGGRKVPNCVPVAEATLGGKKYMRKANPNNSKSKKTSDEVNTKLKDALGGVADAKGNMRKRLIQKGTAAFKVGLAQKYKE